jgi:hypothetical protein
MRYYDEHGNRREITPEETAEYNAWADRQAERVRRARLAQKAGQGAPSPNSSGSNRENGPRIRY